MKAASSQSRSVKSLDTSPQVYQMPDRSLDTSASEISHIRSLDTSPSDSSQVYQMPDRSLDTSPSDNSQVYQMPENSQYTTYQEAQQVWGATSNIMNLIFLTFILSKSDNLSNVPLLLS